MRSAFQHRQLSRFIKVKEGDGKCFSGNYQPEPKLENGFMSSRAGNVITVPATANCLEKRQSSNQKLRSPLMTLSRAVLAVSQTKPTLLGRVANATQSAALWILMNSAKPLEAIMTPAEFREWRDRLGLNRIEAAAVLGLGRNQPQRYEDGQTIPKYIALACAAVAHGLTPIGDDAAPAPDPAEN